MRIDLANTPNQNLPPNNFRPFNQSGPRRSSDRFRNKPKKRFKSYFLLTLIILGGIFIHQIFFASNTASPLQGLTRLPVIREIRGLVGANSGLLKGEARDRINVLVLGQGGLGHPGPYLTDTIILASFRPSTGQIAVLSIPRDMVVKIPDVGLERVNTANAFGEANNYPGGGAALAARVLEKTLKIPINYYVRIDFAGFEKLIDEMGGVELTIDNAFVDDQYPDNKFGYQTISFTAGVQTLTGEQALQYVRSRHASNGEGGDFARARRQQKLLLALKDETLATKNLLNPSRLVKYYETIEKHVATNLQLWEIPAFLNLSKSADFNSIIFKVLDDSPAGPLYSTTTESGAYVLAPKISDYSEIQFIVKNMFTIFNIKNEASQLVIQNGTAEEGLALNTAAILNAFEFNIAKISNAASQNYKKTVLYDFTGETKPSSRKFLESTLQTKAQGSLPLTEEFPDTDFLIILGNDQVPQAQARQEKVESSIQ